jgi:hypothetical protein
MFIGLSRVFAKKRKKDGGFLIIGRGSSGGFVEDGGKAR